MSLKGKTLFERPVLTTQLYFPDEPANRHDGLFRRDLEMRITESHGRPRSAFRFCARHAVTV
jgi:protocatechuate 3,4-dioxygenase beta subunit